MDVRLAQEKDYIPDVWGNREDATHYFTGSALLASFAAIKGVGNVDTTSMTIEGIGTPSYT